VKKDGGNMKHEIISSFIDFVYLWYFRLRWRQLNLSR